MVLALWGLVSMVSVGWEMALFCWDVGLECEGRCGWLCLSYLGIQLHVCCYRC